MGIFGWATGGASGFGPSSLRDLLPYKGWKEAGQEWLEEAVDAIGLELDFRNLKFFRAQARANLLDPSYTPTAQDPADAYIANATTAPNTASVRDTMLDVLLYIALGYYPADTNLSVAQKQALIAVGWNALRRKGTRLQILNLASKMADGVAFGWTVPPFNFSVIVPDGTPSPGTGVWVQPSAGIAEVQRPWVLQAIRTLLGRGMASDWSQLGVCFSQFRVGYSGAGESVFVAGARFNLLAHEHFDSWSVGLPVGWTRKGAAPISQSTSDTGINWEFTGSAAVLDLTAQALGSWAGLSNSSTINNQLTHRFQLDYKYTNQPSVGILCVQIAAPNADGNTYYWNPDTATWVTAAYNIVVPPSATRARFAFDVVPQAASSTSTAGGTPSITATVFATSDGTATTQTTYTLYRVGLYEKFSLTIEQAALGERTLWLPLVDAMGWATGSRTSGGIMLEPANASRSAYKTVAATATHFPYHPALTGRGFRAHSSWTNLLKGSNDFGADWSIVNATKTSNANVSPAIGDSGTAPTLTATTTNAALSQAFATVPANKSYVGGVWVKKLSADGNFTDVTLTLGATSILSQSFTLKQSQGWVLLPFQFNFGGAEVNSMIFKIDWGAASSNGQIAVADAYLYEVTGTTGVLYPPVVRTAVGATASSNASSALAITAGANVLHPLTQRALASVVRGSFGAIVVPTFDAASQFNGVIFDVAQRATQNRILLRVAGGAKNLQFIRWDDLGNTWQAFVSMTSSATPAAGSMTWRRDTPIIIRCVWDENSTMLTAGNGSAMGTKPGSWGPTDASLGAIGIGNDFNGANPFDGTVTLIEVDQLGAPSS